MKTLLSQILEESSLPVNGTRYHRNGGCKCSANSETQELEVSEAEQMWEATVPNIPAPGQYYQIQPGEGGLLTTVGKAYRVGEGKGRLHLAQLVNMHPLNRRFWVTPGDSFSKQSFPKGIISFTPIFTCGSNQRLAKPSEKKCFASIYLPKFTDGNSCALPPGKNSRELEQETLFREAPSRRPAPQPAKPVVRVKPKVSIFQDHTNTSHRNHFQCGASFTAKKRSAAAISSAETCTLKVGAIPYKTGADIIAAMNNVHKCLGKKLDEIHIFSHGMVLGLPGVVSDKSYGLYSFDFFTYMDSSARANGARVVADIPAGILADNVVFVLHGCNMASMGMQGINFAKALFDHLKGSLSSPRVFAHRDAGCASRNNNWREYSTKHPDGQNVRSLSLYQAGKCCS